jgi:hypothetical protein
MLYLIVQRLQHVLLLHELGRTSPDCVNWFFLMPLSPKLQITMHKDIYLIRCVFVCVLAYSRESREMQQNQLIRRAREAS